MVREKRGPLLLHQLRRSRMNNQTQNDCHRTSRNFLQDRCSHVCRREHDRSLRHQRLSLDLIAGDYRDMGCRGEFNKWRGKRDWWLLNQMPATKRAPMRPEAIARRTEQLKTIGDSDMAAVGLPAPRPNRG
jgi:hypothetical protein